MDTERWIVANASSSNENFGPGLIAVAVRASDLAGIIKIHNALKALSVEVAGWGRVTWFNVETCLFDMPDEGAVADMLATLDEPGVNSVLLPEGIDLPALLQADPYTDTDEWTEELSGAEVRPGYGDSCSLFGEVHTRALVKHTDVVIRSIDSITPHLEELCAYFGLAAKEDLPENQRHIFSVIVSGCTYDQANTVLRERLGHDEDYGFNYSIQF